MLSLKALYKELLNYKCLPKSYQNFFFSTIKGYLSYIKESILVKLKFNYS